MSILAAMQGSIDLLTKGKEIYEKTARYMDEAEKSTEPGAKKKEIVLALVRDFVIELGKNWDKWAAYIIEFIDLAKWTFNLFKGISKF